MILRAREVLAMVKPIYGLKDAPRAWRRKLDKVLRSWKRDKSSGLQPLKAAPEIYVAHEIESDDKAISLRQKAEQLDAIKKVILANAVQQEMTDEEAQRAEALQTEIWKLTRVR